VVAPKQSRKALKVLPKLAWLVRGPGIGSSQTGYIRKKNGKKGPEGGQRPRKERNHLREPGAKIAISRGLLG